MNRSEGAGPGDAKNRAVAVRSKMRSRPIEVAVGGLDEAGVGRRPVQPTIEERVKSRECAGPGDAKNSASVARTAQQRSPVEVAVGGLD